MTLLENLKILLNVVGDSNDENSFLHKFLLTNAKFQTFVKLFLKVHQLILNYQKVSCLKENIQEGF